MHKHDICRFCGACHLCHPLVHKWCVAVHAADVAKRDAVMGHMVPKHQSSPIIPFLGQNGTKPRGSDPYRNWYGHIWTNERKPSDVTQRGICHLCHKMFDKGERSDESHYHATKGEISDLLVKMGQDPLCHTKGARKPKRGTEWA